MCLETRGRRATIVGATSGDTGGAAIEAFAVAAASTSSSSIPTAASRTCSGGMMTTPPSQRPPHRHQGHFDDCQALVKALFNDQRSATGGADGRQLDQLGAHRGADDVTISPRRDGAWRAAPAGSFAVPTGNFGDIFAG